MRNLFLSLFIVSVTYSASAQEVKTTDADDLQKAEQLINGYQFAEALKFLDPKDSLDLNIVQRRAYCFLRLGNYLSAIRQYEKALQLDSANVNVLFQLGQLYARNNQFGSAYECFGKLIAADSSNSFYYKQYAIVANQANDVFSAIGFLSKAVKLNPRDIEAYTMYGNALLDIDQFEIADSVLHDALQLNNSPQLRLLLAKAQLGEKKYHDVIKTTEQLMAKGDTIPAYARLLGISYFQLDQFDKVLPFMKYLLDRDMKADWIYYYIGSAYQQTHQPDSAIAYLNKAIEAGISENISNYYTQLASSYEDKKDYKSAIKYYKAAYESSKADILLYHLARNYDVYYKDKSQAIAYYKRYLHSDDTIKIAKEYTKYRLDELSVYR